eukprot:gene11390-13462_t
MRQNLVELQVFQARVGRIYNYGSGSDATPCAYYGSTNVGAGRLDFRGYTTSHYYIAEFVREMKHTDASGPRKWTGFAMEWTFRDAAPTAGADVSGLRSAATLVKGLGSPTRASKKATDAGFGVADEEVAKPAAAQFSWKKA